MRLLRNVNNGSIIEWAPERDGNPKYTELSEDEVFGYLGYSAVKSGTTVRMDPKTDGVVLYTTSMGIGDAITVLYAACGLAAEGYKVTYNTRHYAWLQHVSQPNLTLKPLGPEEKFGGVDVNQDYMDQLWEGYIGRLQSRPHWALRAIRIAYPSIPERIQPCRPAQISCPEPIVEGEYVVLAPYSSAAGPMRDWPMSNYAMLVHKLTRTGHRCYVVMTHEHKDEAHWFDMPGTKVWIDTKPADVVRLVAHAQAVIANDSGIAHVGGLYEAPTFVIMAIVKPSQTFAYTNVRGIVPSPRVKCRFCCWQKEGGLIPACTVSCGAIATITPDDVLDVLQFEVEKKPNIPVFVRSA